MTAARVRPMQWKLFALLAAAALIVAAVIVSRREDAVAVWTAPSSFQDVDRTVTTNGTVVPTNEFQARAFWPGIIDRVDVELGDKVKPGQLLVSMRDPFAISRLATANATLQGARVGNENIQNGGSQEDLIGIKGNLQQAEISQSEAQKSFDALKQLQAKGAASAAEVELARKKLQAANASLATLQAKSSDRYRPGDRREAQAKLADAQAAVDAARNQFNNANIHSPMAGTVYSINVVAYDFVPVGADLIRVADLNNVEVKAFFDEPEIGKLEANQPVTIVWDGKPGRTWHGHIKQAPMAAMALGARSVGECIIAVDDAKEDLLPNTNVMITVRIQHHIHVLTVPRAALHTDGATNYVYRIQDGKLARTVVDVGIINLERAEIMRGLTPNDTVVLNALDNRRLRDGMPVRVASSTSGPSVNPKP
jgi:HlyD family secretion protein